MNPKEEIVGDKENAQEESPINNVSDFIFALKERFNRESTPEEEKRLLAHQLFKINLGLNTAGLKADEVLVRRLPDGVLGLYNSGNRKISAAENLLEDFSADSRLFKTVFVHEATHKEGIMDEGLNMLKIKKEFAVTPGIYEKEQQAAARTLSGVGVDKSLGIYDWDHPEKLVDYYLEVEIDKCVKEKVTKSNLGRILEREADELSKRLNKGLPDLFSKYKMDGDSIRNKIRKILSAKEGKN